MNYVLNTHLANVLPGFAGRLACVLLSKFLITVWHNGSWISVISTSISFFKGLDGRGFVGIHFYTPVLTSTRAGITATAMRGTTEARIIGVMLLANKKENGKYAVLLVTFCANARSADRAFGRKRETRFKRIWARLLRSILCADWLTFVWQLNEMKVGHVLRQCALFKRNYCNWSSYLQLYFKIIIFI